MLYKAYFLLLIQFDNTLVDKSKCEKYAAPDKESKISDIHGNENLSSCIFGFIIYYQPFIS